MRRLLSLLTVAVVLACAAPVLADEPAALSPLDELKQQVEDKSVALDTVWVLVTAFLVMLMQAGFAMVETGFTRVKNAVNICMKNLLDFSIGSIAFWAVGFGLMFSIGSGALENWVGNSGFFLTEEPALVMETVTAEDGTESEQPKEGATNFDPISWTSVPLTAKFFFQLVFAATAATIVSGAMAERTKFTSYLLYSVVITAFIYPISGHWIWGGGWLADEGMFDFAGSTVVHSVGGWLALTGALILGPRIGKFGPDGKPRAIPGSNIPLATLGVFILWFGWFGFNPGSTMAAAAADISHIVCTTNIAAAAGAIAALLVSKLVLKNWDSGMALNGALAGLVAITCPCAWVTIDMALCIGLIAGVAVVASILFLERVCKIDDPVGAISVHGVCGALGTLALGLFANPEATGIAGPKQGLFFGGGAEQLIAQATGVGLVFGWCMATGLTLFGLIRLTVGLRVSPEEELQGLDIGEHGNEAYYGFVMAQESLTGAFEPKAATVPPDGQKRFKVVVDGVPTEELMDAWTQLCQAGKKPPSPQFKAVYPYMTMVEGNRFHFRGGDPKALSESLRALFQARMDKKPIRVYVESTSV